MFLLNIIYFSLANFKIFNRTLPNTCVRLYICGSRKTLNIFRLRLKWLKLLLGQRNDCVSLRWGLCHFAEEHRRSACRASKDVLCWNRFGLGVSTQLWYRSQRPETWQVSSSFYSSEFVNFFINVLFVFVVTCLLQLTTVT